MRISIPCSDRQLSCPLIAKLQDDAGRVKERRKYQPRPNFALLKDDFPWFLVEVDSFDNHNDKYRLQVQMACSLNFALTLRQLDGINDEQFFLMGAVFAHDWKIYRYFFYSEEGKVRLRIPISFTLYYSLFTDVLSRSAITKKCSI